ncbi:MAG TPA: hypothetical protein VFT42_03480 [Solirubrobacteraceae bacterium]|nr:hypothetical protein [Solirubrobacteraceae bacterium]
MASNVISLIAIVGGALSLLALVWIAARGDSSRDEEDAARAYFDLHGRWPDD